MEIEFTKDLILNPDQEAILEMHSVLNIANVLLEEIKTMQLIVGNNEDFKPIKESLEELKNKLSQREKTFEWLDRYHIFHKQLATIIKNTYRLDKSLLENHEMNISQENLISILDIFETRVRELVARKDNPYIWIDHEIYALKESFVNIISSFQMNSKGKYKIAQNVESKNGADYLVEFKIVSITGMEIINMPAALQDSIRDLVANARKYTQPGGWIRAELIDEGAVIHFKIEDSGIGIPEAEMFYITDFGHRASNVIEHRQMGGGFGLTKAYHLVKKFNGTLKVKSSLGKGTTIDLIIPRI